MMYAHPRLLKSRSAIAAVLVLLAAACSDDPDDDPGPGGDGPLYLVATTFSAGDQDETYLVTTDRFDAQTALDPTSGPKLLGGVVPTVHNGAVFVPDSSAPVIVRFDVGANDRLTRGAEVSFAGVGMTKIVSWHVYIVSPTKGYVFDPAGNRIIVWNPETMALAGKQIDVSGIARPGMAPNLVFEHSGPRRRGNQLIIPLGWTAQDGNSRFATGVVILDTEADSVISIDEDERCGESYTTIAAPNGDVYFFPPDWSATPHYFADLHKPTCVIRVAAGATTLDDGPPLDLSALGTGSAAAGAVPDGDDGFFFTSVDEALWDNGNNRAGSYWRVYHYDFGTGMSRQVTSIPVWTGHLYYVNVDGKSYLPYLQDTASGKQTTIYSMNGVGDPAPVFSFGASWYGFARLR